MDIKGEEDFDLERKTPERGKLPPRLVELECFLVITTSLCVATQLKLIIYKSEETRV